jgi:hypothetical protein
MAIGLGKRVRAVQHQGVVTDRKAALYVSTLVRHAARLLQSTATHDVPQLRAGAGGPGGRVTHYVIRHDRLAGPPSAVRLLLVGSDARLRCCVIADQGGARIWVDYDANSAPADLSVRVVMRALSALIGRLEQTVSELEIRQITREAELDAEIALSKARIAGLPEEPATTPGVRREAVSEEPVRPWTRHLARLAAARPSARAATPAADATAASEAPAGGAVAAPIVGPAVTDGTMAGPSVDDHGASVAPTDDRFPAATPAVDAGPAHDEPPTPVHAAAGERPHRSLRFTRLGRAI